MNALFLTRLALVRDLVRLRGQGAEIIAETFFWYGNFSFTRNGRPLTSPTPPAKLTLAVVSRFFLDRSAGDGQAEHVGSLHRLAFAHSPPGNPAIQDDRYCRRLRGLILTIARENPSWGQGRIADELVAQTRRGGDSRTLGKYMRQSGRLPSAEWIKAAVLRSVSISLNAADPQPL